jgi:hypothetical protein
LYGELRPGDTFTCDNTTEALWMIVGVEEMPEKEGWFRIHWTYLEDVEYGVYEEERDGMTYVEDDWPLIQRGPL